MNQLVEIFLLWRKFWRIFLLTYADTIIMEDGKQELGEYSETNTSTWELTVSVTAIALSNKHIKINLAEGFCLLNQQILSNHRYTRGGCSSLWYCSNWVSRDQCCDKLWFELLHQMVKAWNKQYPDCWSWIAHTHRASVSVAISNRFQPKGRTKILAFPIQSNYCRFPEFAAKARRLFPKQCLCQLSQQ